MKTYEEVVNKVANTLVTASIDRTVPFGFYLSDNQISYHSDVDKEVVEMDVQMAKEDAVKRLTRSFA